jgi:hypothetical protein
MEKEPTKLTQIWLRNAAFSAHSNDSSLSHVGVLFDNFRMNTRSGRYGAAYNMVGLLLF